MQTGEVALVPDKRKDEEAEAEGEQIKDNHAGEGVMDVGSGLLDVGDAEKVEMEGGKVRATAPSHPTMTRRHRMER